MFSRMGQTIPNPLSSVFSLVGVDTGSGQLSFSLPNINGTHALAFRWLSMLDRI
jgi:hypothetical protein